MSRSRKIPILKDRPRNKKKSTTYWRTIRRVINQRVKLFAVELPESEDIPDPKSIINDYDYCDYIISYIDGFSKDVKHIEKMKHK